MEFMISSISSTEFEWEANSYVNVGMRSKSLMLINANKEGLLSLAHHLLELANTQDSAILYEPWPGDLETGSIGIEVRKVQCSGR